MSLDKAIKHGKEKRKIYRGAKAVDPWCRNHGNCKSCQKSRKLKFIKKQQSAESKIKAVAVKDCWSCDACLYVGEGDHWCDETHEIVIEDFIPNENYLCCQRERKNNAN